MSSLTVSNPPSRLKLPHLPVERWIFWLATAALTVAILYPASMSVYAAFVEQGHFSLGGFERIFQSRTVGREIATTLIFAAGSTLVDFDPASLGLDENARGETGPVLTHPARQEQLVLRQQLDGCRRVR